MDRRLMDYLDRKMGNRDYRSDSRDNRRSSRMNRSGRDRRDYQDHRDYNDNRDYEDSRRDYNDYEDNRRDYNDGNQDYRENDYRGPKMKLRKSDMKRWKNEMENSDGSKGEHFDMQQVMHAVDKLGLKFDEYDEKEFCLAVNMMYSDYGRTIKKYVSPEKELMVCAELAKDFFDDPDGPEPSEKLALYYYCIVDNEEV